MYTAVEIPYFSKIGIVQDNMIHKCEAEIVVTLSQLSTPVLSKIQYENPLSFKLKIILHYRKI